MQLGVVFPQTEIPPDPGAVRAFAQGVEALGFDYVMVSDHVLGANAKTHPTWKGTWNNSHSFFEPLVTLSFMASVTSRLGLATGIMLLPLRQTALVAKQTAMLDVLSNGRLRLGFGLGREETLVEYEGLGTNFHNRGKRSEEQVALLRALWTKDTVSFKGKWHTVTEAGINPLPVQRPIPVWLGGAAEPVLERIGRYGNGWLTTRLVPGDDALSRGLETIKTAAKLAGRDPATIGLDGRVRLLGSTLEGCVLLTERWRRMGASHATVNTWESGAKGADQHLKVLGEIRQGIGR